MKWEYPKFTLRDHQTNISIHLLNLFLTSLELCEEAGVVDAGVGMERDSESRGLRSIVDTCPATVALTLSTWGIVTCNEYNMT